MNEGRIGSFAEELRGWSFDEERAMGVEGNVGLVQRCIPMGGGQGGGRAEFSRYWLCSDLNDLAYGHMLLKCTINFNVIHLS